MKMQRFNALGIEIKLKDWQFFHDEGTSEDILGKTIEVAQRYHACVENYTRNITQGGRGICHSFPLLPIPKNFSGEQHLHIIYRESGGLMTCAHEETHAIDYLGCGGRLHTIIAKEFNLSPKTNFYLNLWGLEGYAIIGSIFALHRKGLALDQILKMLDERYTLSMDDFKQLFPPFGRI